MHIRTASERGVKVEETRGRPKGSKSKKSAVTFERWVEVAAQGELPHEFLLRVSRGGAIDHVDAEGKPTKVYPTFPMRVECAQAAAPYFAPRLSAVEVIQGVADEQLDEIITGAASQAGVSISLDRTGTEATIKIRAGGSASESSRVIEGAAAKGHDLIGAQP